MGIRKGATKLTCDISNETNEQLETLISKLKKKSRFPSSISKTYVCETIIKSVVDLSEDVKQELAEICLKKSKEHNLKSFDVSDFQEEKEIKMAKQFKELADMYDEFNLVEKKIKESKYSMKTIQLKNGQVQFPDNWKVAYLNEKEECNYAYVIEVSDEYNLFHAPHIVVLSQFKLDLNKDSSLIYDAASVVYKQIKELLKKEVQPIYDENNNWINMEAWRKSPKIGIFQIDELGDADVYPYDAVIVRN